MALSSLSRLKPKGAVAHHRLDLAENGLATPGSTSRRHGSGQGVGDLTFENPVCPKQKFSARIGIAVTHYGCELAMLIKSEDSPYGLSMGGDHRQAIKDATSEVEQEG